jgi:hypothetical protein
VLAVLWILAALFVVAGIVFVVVGDVVAGLALVVVGTATGPGGVSALA